MEVPGVTSNNISPGAAILFLHIHKTAGTTLHRIIEGEYNPFRIYTIFGGAIEWSINHFKQLPERRLAALQVVKGHMSFGLHEYLPQPSTYITFLRDPVERCISAYSYSKANPANPFYHRINRERLDLLAFLDLARWNQNLQCKTVAGIDRTEFRPVKLLRRSLRAGAPPSEQELDRWSNASVLEKAKENLVRHFSFVGVSDRFPEGLVLLKHLFGWRFSSYSSYRKSRGRPKTESLDPEILAAVEKRNEFDRALYDFGKRMFADTIERQDIDVEREVAAIRENAIGKQKSIFDFGGIAARAAASHLASLL
ncbi:MAG: sulfotransferase family 2 domain-containing protein [Verrucomicrobia bacterium]|nr:sulfotransferase family 2 domain-containing protein [Verrucomicrobiota bacterium]